MLETLVRKSSGQFIYASTVVKFVESSCHKPPARLNIILGISPPGKLNPFAELDALYTYLLASVDDIQTTLRVLGDIHLSLVNLSSILTYHESSGEVEVLHASLVDFLSDPCRSASFYIDTESLCTGFLRRLLECVKAPDGIRAGDIRLFRGLRELWIPEGQLQSDISSFDIDAFINASIACHYYGEHCLTIRGSTLEALDIWHVFCHSFGGLQYYKEALDRLDISFMSRLRIYLEFDWRLKLLLALAVAAPKASDASCYPSPIISFSRYVDILLEIENHSLCLVDQHAFDLRHTYSHPTFNIGSHVDGDAYASAALHCMHFLSKPPKYSEGKDHLEMGQVIYSEWRATCMKTVDVLCELLKRANTLPELVKIMSEHNIHPAVQKIVSGGRMSKVNESILKFLSQANDLPV